MSFLRSTIRLIQLSRNCRTLFWICDRDLGFYCCDMTKSNLGRVCLILFFHITVCQRKLRQELGACSICKILSSYEAALKFSLSIKLNLLTLTSDSLFRQGQKTATFITKISQE
ncbi:uncharacterized protein LOC110305007 [Mus caroli]|uniref:Uncharacterized protein LOC110305007 n=1 Tax=Mus caroli TaxID=10089 RepID=A0A6P5QPU3_MUSCR|nr:uncharacterized protein LOC110305007 [Mus caroli]